MTKILFVCTGNSARSQFAEAFARYYAGDMLQVASAGTSPAGLNPNAVWAMNEVGIDMRHQTSDPLSAFRLSDFDCVVTLCGDARDNCPPLPQGVRQEHWSIPDPAKSRGAPSEILKAFRAVRYQVERRVKALLERELRKS
jgi:arsenate reductase